MSTTTTQPSIPTSGLFAGVDMSDPCAVLDKLRPAYYTLLAGRQAVNVQFDDRTVQFSHGDAQLLREEMARLESECALKQGLPRRRRAISGGTRRFTTRI